MHIGDQIFSYARRMASSFDFFCRGLIWRLAALDFVGSGIFLIISYSIIGRTGFLPMPIVVPISNNRPDADCRTDDRSDTKGHTYQQDSNCAV